MLLVAPAVLPQGHEIFDYQDNLVSPSVTVVAVDGVDGFTTFQLQATFDTSLAHNVVSRWPAACV